MLAIVYEEFERSRVIIGTTNMGARMTMAFGSDALKAEALPRFAAGIASSCLGFTEPSCGSDVFAARTRAVRGGEDWIVNGQKIFTTGAHVSDYVLLLTRTDLDAPKHKGLTMFLVPMTLRASPCSRWIPCRTSAPTSRSMKMWAFPTGIGWDRWVARSA